jgi:hypothetical protein
VRVVGGVDVPGQVVGTERNGRPKAAHGQRQIRTCQDREQRRGSVAAVGHHDGDEASRMLPTRKLVVREFRRTRRRELKRWHYLGG